MMLTPIKPTDLTEQEILDIAKVSVRAKGEPPATQFIEEALKGLLQIHRIDEGGLVGLELHKRPQGVEMWIAFVTGKSMLTKAVELLSAIKAEAKKLHCASLATMASPSIARVYKHKLGLRPVDLLFRIGMENG